MQGVADDQEDRPSVHQQVEKDQGRRQSSPDDEDWERRQRHEDPLQADDRSRNAAGEDPHVVELHTWHAGRRCAERDHE